MAVATALLGRIESEIRCHDQVVGTLAVCRADRNADADRRPDAIATELERFADCLDERVSELIKCRARFDVARYDGKFVAAQPGQDIGRSERKSQPLRRFLQQKIADT